MKKRLISLIVTIGLLTTISMPVFAEPIGDSFTIQNEAYSQAQNKVEGIEISIEKFDLEIGKINTEVHNAKEKMAKTQIKIESAKQDIQFTQGNILQEQDLFNKRMRSVYINGAHSYLEIILNSEGITDLVARVENIKKIVEYDNDIIGELTAKKDKIADQRQTLEIEKTNLAVLTTENEGKIRSLKDKKQEQSLLIVESKKQRELYAGKSSEAQNIVNDSISQITKLRDDAPRYTASRGTSSLSSSSIVAYASNFLGTPYAYGANGPSSFDCSGFVKYVYSHFGVSLSRTTTTQVNEGSYVARDNLRPGDLIFFGASSDPHHVGMYVGNNSYIHAPSTGDVVKISALTRRDYLTARRVK